MDGRAVKRRSSLLPRRPARKISKREHAIGLALLALMGVTLGLFVLAGRRDGPPSLIAGEAPLVVSPYALKSPAGWPRGAVEDYDVDSLFEKINGKADAYVAFDVVGLTFAGYTKPEDPGIYVDLYVYDMAEPLNAYGIYRTQRSGREKPMTVAEEGCSSGSAFFGRKGRHYVEAVGSGPEATAEAGALLNTVLAALPAGQAPVQDPTWFPAEGRLRVQYARSNALGVEALGDAFLARYSDGVDAIVARCASAAEAEAARKEAEETLEFLSTPALFVVLGETVVGAVGSKDEERLSALVAAIAARVKEAP